MTPHYHKAGYLPHLIGMECMDIMTYSMHVSYVQVSSVAISAVHVSV